MAVTAGAIQAEDLRPVRGGLGPLDVVQLLLVELVVVVLLVVVNLGLTVSAIGVTVAAASTLRWGRQRGRTRLEWAIVRRRYRRRRRARPGAGPSEDWRLSILGLLAEGLHVDEVTIADGSRVGVAIDGAGWFAVAEVAPQADQHGVPCDVLVRALAGTDAPGAALQVVTHYEHGARAAIWVAVRLDAQSLAEAGAEELDGVPAAVVVLVRRLVRTLHRDGFSAAPLDRAGLLAAMARSCALDRVHDAGQAAQPPPSEEWQSWHTGDVAHRTFWVRGWPRIADAGELLATFGSVEAVLTSVSIVVVPDGDGADVRCLARVGARPRDLDRICDNLGLSVQHFQATLFQLDGEQAAGAYASAPTGGGPR